MLYVVRGFGAAAHRQLGLMLRHNMAHSGGKQRSKRVAQADVVRDKSIKTLRFAYICGEH